MNNKLLAVSDYVPADSQEKYVSVAQVYEKIQHLHPFSQQENEMISKILNKKHYRYLEEVDIEVCTQLSEYCSKLYPAINIKEWKKFSEKVNKQLINVPNNEQIYITLFESENTCEDDTKKYYLTFHVPTIKDDDRINEKVVAEITSCLENHRNSLKQKKEEQERKIRVEKMKKQREDAILELIKKLQDKVITPEEFKIESEKLR